MNNEEIDRPRRWEELPRAQVDEPPDCPFGCGRPGAVWCDRCDNWLCDECYNDHDD